MTIILFQYPQADRRGCNIVKTNSNAEKTLRFSIHKRIEGGATQDGMIPSFPMERFQYPQADRRGCNGVIYLSKDQLDYMFQYPQADRRGCNQIDYRLLENLCLSFQYPQADRRGCNRPCLTQDNDYYLVSVSTSGSKGVQPPPRPGCCSDFLTFQYPQADRRGCNL